MKAVSWVITRRRFEKPWRTETRTFFSISGTWTEGVCGSFLSWNLLYPVESLKSVIYLFHLYFKLVNFLFSGKILFLVRSLILCLSLYLGTTSRWFNVWYTDDDCRTTLRATKGKREYFQRFSFRSSITSFNISYDVHNVSTTSLWLLCTGYFNPL